MAAMHIFVVLCFLALHRCSASTETCEGPSCGNNAPSSTESPPKYSPDANTLGYDPNGYLLYCLCMGRFGNQVDYFLGAMKFAKETNRTLVLAPFINYDRGATTFTEIDEVFDIDAIQEYVPAIPMWKFMKELAPTIWPKEQRKAYCLTHRNIKPNNPCDPKNGNPPGTYWNHYGIDFADQLHSYNGFGSPTSFQKAFPPSEHLVLPWTSTVGSYPVERRNVFLQKYLRFNSRLMNLAKSFLAEQNMSGRAFMAVHVRFGLDWKSACEHTKGLSNFMSSVQCTLPNEVITPDVCYPSIETMAATIKSALQEKSLTNLFVGTDDENVIVEFRKLLPGITVFSQKKKSKDNAYIDLIMFEQADYFLGNCISSFTGFSIRARNLRGMPSGFWGIPSS